MQALALVCVVAESDGPDCVCGGRVSQMHGTRLRLISSTGGVGEAIHRSCGQKAMSILLLQHASLLLVWW